MQRLAIVNRHLGLQASPRPQVAEAAPAPRSATCAIAAEVGKRPLCRNGPLVSAIGFGAWPIGGGMGVVDADVGGDAVREAVRSGQSFIDTAEMYEIASTTQERLAGTGQVGSERVIGRALADHLDLKSEAFYATKASVQPYTRENIHAAAMRSVSNLQVDTIDLYQLHGVDNETPIAEQMSALKELQDAGTITYIGLNNMSATAQLDAAWATGVRFHTLQVRYNMFARDIEEEVVPWCRKHGVGILAHSVLGKGLLTGKYRPGHVFPEDDERADPSRAVRDSSFSHCLRPDNGS